MSEEKKAQAPKEKVKLTVTQVQEDLRNGLDRVAIGEKYGLNKTDVARLFEHEKLKGLKVKRAPAFELEDDAPEVGIPTRKTKKKAEEAARAEQTTATSEETSTSTEEETSEEKKEETPKEEKAEGAGDTQTGMW